MSENTTNLISNSKKRPGTIQVFERLEVRNSAKQVCVESANGIST